MKILDISQFNNVRNLTEALQKVDGVIVRLGYRGYGISGKLIKDIKFRSYVKTLVDSGKPWGAYFVSQAVTTDEATEEAFFCIDELNKLDLDNFKLGLWFDSEYCSPNHDGRGDKISKTRRTKYANEFCKIAESYGFKTGVYCSDSWVDTHLVENEILFPFWVAKYGVNNGLVHDGKPKHDNCMWQYTSRAKVSGIVGYVDMSLCYFLEVKKPTFEIPSLKGYKGFSLVDGLKSYGYESSFTYRKKVAQALGIATYKGTAKQNTALLALLKNR